MIKKRSARVALLACAGVASLGLLVGPASATAKVKKKTVTRTATVNQCISIGSAIADHSTATATIPVSLPTYKGQPQDGTVTGLTSVGTRIAHTLGSDLVIGLISPGGRYVALSDGRGDAANFGTGAANCGGTLTTFSDTAAMAIGAGDSPFAGSFKPEQPLTQAVGAPARGTWVLQVTDCCNVDTGAINAFSLNFTYQYKALVKVKKKKKK
jgi:subtilisin-like proprotein convertase family protein